MKQEMRVNGGIYPEWALEGSSQALPTWEKRKTPVVIHTRPASDKPPALGALLGQIQSKGKKD